MKFYSVLVLLLLFTVAGSAQSPPPLPEGLPILKQSPPVKKSKSRAKTAIFAPVSPAPQFTLLRSITFTNNHVVLKMRLGVMGYGIAYSDDMVKWVYVGEAHWTNAAPYNPFVDERGVTEHRIWISEKQWSAVHTPGALNEWRITIVDGVKTQRFYRVYPLEPVTGLP